MLKPITSIAIATIIVAVAFCHASPVAAFQPDAEQRKPKQADADDPQKSDDDGKLFQKLTTEGEAEDPLETIERIVKNMRGAQERISADDVGKDTRGLQKSALDDVNELIKLAQAAAQQSQNNQQQQPKNQQQPQADNQPGKKKQNREGSKPASASKKPQQGAKPQPTTSKSPPGDETKQGKTDDSEEGLRKAQAREAEFTRRRAMIKDVWGHLPPQLRDRILSVTSENYLPRYESTVRRYFEVLAEDEDAP